MGYADDIKILGISLKSIKATHRIYSNARPGFFLKFGA
jgi:hypothetical protein